ncbi:MAG: hypothetical protein HQL95_04190 [Magnetococcales bacterium]|nr:hypothetical protein [Magnetococcales bacterium]
MTRLVIWDRLESPETGLDGTILLWRSYDVAELPYAVSIPWLVETQADALKERYLAWIYQFGEARIDDQRLVDRLELREGFSYWWITPFVEMCNYTKSLWIDQAIKLMAFDAWARERTITGMRVHSGNRALRATLQAWCARAGIACEVVRVDAVVPRVSMLRRVFHWIPLGARAWIWLIRHLIDRWPLKGVGLREWRTSKARVSFISYLLYLSPAALAEKRYASHYWAHLPDMLLQEGCKTNWLHIFVKDRLVPDARQAARVLREFNQQARGGQVHVALHAFLSARVVLATLRDWLRIAWISRRLTRSVARMDCHGLVLWPLFEEEWRNAMVGPMAMSNHLYVNLFHEAWRLSPHQEKGVYLQENMDWEYACLWAWKHAGHQEILGVSHSTVRYWDLRYYYDPRTYIRTARNAMPRPDRVAVNGDAARTRYLEGGYPVSELVEVEALRYLYLLSMRGRRTHVRHPSGGQARLLVFGDYVRQNTDWMLRMVAESARGFGLQEKAMILVKPHISCPVSRADYPGVTFEITMNPITELLRACDMVFASSTTSAAVDAYCSGVPVIVCLNPEGVNLSPLRGESGVRFVSTPEELATAVAEAGTMAEEVGTSLEYFKLDERLPAWRRLLFGRDESDALT